MKILNLLMYSLFALLVVGNLQAQSDDKPAPGLVSLTVLEEGDGEKPKEGQEVGFHSVGKDEEGNVLWDSKPIGFLNYEIIGDEKENELMKAVENSFLLMEKGGVYEIKAPKALLGVEQAAKITGENVIIRLELEEFGDPKPSGEEQIKKRIDEEGVEAAAVWYNETKNDNPEAYTFREGPLNALGYDYLSKEEAGKAIAVFTLNANIYPESANVYDSLADGYIAAGDKEKAIANLEKALDINPESEYYKKRLEELQKED